MTVQPVVAVLIALLTVAIVRACRRRREGWTGPLAAAALAAALGDVLVFAAVVALTGRPEDSATAVAGVVGGAACGVLAGLAVTGRRRAAGAVTRAALAVAVLVAAVAIGATTPPPAARASGAADRPTPGAPTAAPVPVWRVADLSSGPGYRAIQRWRVPAITAAQDEPMASWRSAGAPASGRLGSVVIPGTASHFPARPALLWLPPAALTRDPARLPVVVAFSGQSRGAAPIDLERPGGIAAIMDAIAARHHGVAPIVVVPDQLGPGSPNPMCVNGSLGHVATYITVDVRQWILGHLPVIGARRDWTVAGFSEGGTCAVQFAAGDPRLFGSFVDVSGELAPTDGSLAHTIAVGFHGSRAAYQAATPLALLAAHRPFGDTRAFFAVGALDSHYGPVEPVVERAAVRAGIDAGLWVIPGLAHNWIVGSDGLRWGLDGLASWWGLPAAST